MAYVHTHLHNHTRACQDGGPHWWLNFTFMACEFLQPSLSTASGDFICVLWMQRNRCRSGKVLRTLMYPPSSAVRARCVAEKEWVFFFFVCLFFYLEQFKQSILPANVTRSSAKKYCVCSVMQACLCLPSDISSSISAAGWHQVHSREQTLQKYTHLTPEQLNHYKCNTEKMYWRVPCRCFCTEQLKAASIVVCPFSIKRGRQLECRNLRAGCLTPGGGRQNRTKMPDSVQCCFRAFKNTVCNFWQPTSRPRRKQRGIMGVLRLHPEATTTANKHLYNVTRAELLTDEAAW